jgi:hypothetical protein
MMPIRSAYFTDTATSKYCFVVSAKKARYLVRTMYFYGEAPLVFDQIYHHLGGTGDYLKLLGGSLNGPAREKQRPGVTAQDYTTSYLAVALLLFSTHSFDQLA